MTDTPQTHDSELEHHIESLKTNIQKLQKDFDTYRSEFYRNNFPSSQDFQKYSRFNTRLKIPHFTSLPATCEVGEIGEFGGKQYICSAANTWTITGTQS